LVEVGDELLGQRPGAGAGLAADGHEGAPLRRPRLAPLARRHGRRSDGTEDRVDLGDLERRGHLAPPRGQTCRARALATSASARASGTYRRAAQVRRARPWWYSSSRLPPPAPAGPRPRAASAARPSPGRGPRG